VLRELRTSLAPVVWGTSYLTTTELLPPGRPLFAATVRALPAGLLLLALRTRSAGSVRSVLPRGDWWWRAGVLGSLNIGAFFALLFVTAARLPGGVAAVLTASQALLVVVLSGPVLGQRVRPLQAVAAVGGVAGIALVVLTPTARLDAVGVVAGLAAAVATAIGIVLTRRWRSPVDLLTFTGWQLVAGGLVLLPLLVAVEGLPEQVPLRSWLGLAWLAVPGGAIGYALWFDGIAQLRAVAVSSLALLAPVTAAVLGWLVLGQRLGPVQLLGAAVALGAVLALQGRPPAPSSVRPGLAPLGRERDPDHGGRVPVVIAPLGALDRVEEGTVDGGGAQRGHRPGEPERADGVGVRAVPAPRLHPRPCDCRP
jgi:probable blue pigment (indigoidine) exporter